MLAGEFVMQSDDTETDTFAKAMKDLVVDPSEKHVSYL